MKFPLLGKTVAIGGVLLALTLALQFVSAIVSERKGRLQEAERSVAASLASQQTLLGPVILQNCVEFWISEQGEGKDRKSVPARRDFALVSTPATLDVNASATIETRYRGIFKVNGYSLQATLKARWADTAELKPTAEHDGGTLNCEAPVMFVAVGDARGIRTAKITVGGAALAVLPGTEHAKHPRGFHAVLPAPALAAAGAMQADIALELVGTGELGFTPLGDTTTVALASAWPHPSFVGRFLPNERTVSAQGFTARWQLSALATSAPQDLFNGGVVCALGSLSERDAHCIESFGVAFIEPVNAYVLSDRATKYGLLFIALTFVGVGLVEVMRRLRVHPVQYLLVGSALAVFFLLLVSLTEHIAFAWSYLAASAACTALLTFYASFVLRGMRPGAVFGAAIAALYGALYLLLQMEQSALMLGSVLLFAVLSAVMIATRRVDWYALTLRLRQESGAPPAEPTQ